MDEIWAKAMPVTFCGKLETHVNPKRHGCDGQNRSKALRHEWRAQRRRPEW
jgi:hypothetical protein